MKITIVGTGYVGLVTGTCFSDVGIDVTCLDIDTNKIEKLKQGIMPIFEPGLKELVGRNVQNKRLHFTTDIKEALTGRDIIFLAVGTPSCDDGSADLSYVIDVAKQIGKYIDRYTLIVTKSTVPVGTSHLVKKTIQQELDKRGVDIEFDVASNPEFLKEGVAINDFMSPDRVVVGIENQRAEDLMRKLYKPFMVTNYRVIFMDIISAEMTKYAANAMLATRISFMNDIANLCELVGADVNNVRKGIGSDSRIGSKFMYPGCGYGGACFPKDVKALIKTAKEKGYSMDVVEAVERVNDRQKKVLFDKIISHFGSKDKLKGKVIALWGLSFKPETDDMREAPSLVLIDYLHSVGAIIQAYDPVAMTVAKGIIPEGKVKFCNSIYDSVLNADAIVLVTEWKEFRLPSWSIVKEKMRGNIIFDGRNIYEKHSLIESGFVYYGIGIL